jgi:hypothetical protein
LKKETEKSDRLTGIRLDKASAGTDRLFGRKHLDNRELGKMRRYRAERRGREILTPRRAGIDTQADVKIALLMSDVREDDA